MNTYKLAEERNTRQKHSCARSVPIRFALLVGAILVAIPSQALFAQRLTGIPDAAKAVGVDEKLGETISLDQTFVDSNGETTSLGKISGGRLPILLTFNYSDCPGLCVAQLNGLSEVINEVEKIRLGEDFKIVSLSIDPTETPEKLKAFRSRYTSNLPKLHDANGWRFLRGSERDIRSLASSVGFRYTYDAKHNRYSHGSVAIAISPSGKITRYLFEVGYKPETVRMSLIEASEGRIGSPADQILLACFHYNAEEGRYSADARKMLSYAAGIFVIIGLAASTPFWLSSKRRRESASAASNLPDQQTDNDVSGTSDSTDQS